MQVKQSAARQSWHDKNSPAAKPRFSIAEKIGRYEGALWIADPGHHADIFVFGWHGITNDSADHRVPTQWIFFVVRSAQLPAQKSISLAGLQRLSTPYDFAGLAVAVARAIEDIEVAAKPS